MSSELVTKRPAGDGVSAASGTSVGAAASDASTEPRREIWFRRRQTWREQLHEIWQFRELAITLAERDLRARYKQAVLGFAWAVLTPLMLMLAFTFIFTKFAKVNSHGVPYVLFSYIALIPWTFFNNSVSNGSAPRIGRLPVLLAWHQADPPDAFERHRNDVIFTTWQHNRNPFVDHPEWVAAIWG